MLREFAAYYNRDRPHRSLDLHPPRPRSLGSTGPIVSRPILGGRLLRQSDTLRHWSGGRTRRRPGHPRATLRNLQPATVSRVGDKDIPHNRRERRLQLSPRRIDYPGRLVAELEKNDGRDVLLSVFLTIENASRGSLKQLEAART